MRDGRSDAQIAAALGISVNTVRHHLRAIGKKLKTTDRIVIVVRAIMLGIIGLPLPADVLADLERVDDPDEPVE